MQIRRADERDVAGLDALLSQVLEVHAAGRPDLFRTGTRKYTDDELRALLADDARPVFVAVEGGRVFGHAFDICVDEAARGHGVATALYRHVVAYARRLGCHNVTLNVWECNPGARAFYDAMGLVPQKTCLEQVL